VILVPHDGQHLLGRAAQLHTELEHAFGKNWISGRRFALQNGGIVEQGSPKELMEKKGAYYNLYMAQFGDV